MNRQVYAADVYPFSAPNGSKIVVCGHAQGVLFLWRGGDSIKESYDVQKQESDIESDADTSDEEGSENIQPEEAQHSVSVTQKLDLHLGTAVLHLAFPRLPQLQKPRDVPLAPKFLQRDLVAALGCADGSIRLLTLPLEPPSLSTSRIRALQQDPLSGQAGKGTWGEHLVTIPNSHQNIPHGISVGFVSRALTIDTAEEEEQDKNDASGMDVLLASHSTDLSGMLSIHRIPIAGSKNRFGIPQLWRCRPLSAPACEIDVFVPPNGRLPPRVLVGQSNGIVRIFECVSAKHNSGDWSLSLFAPISKISDNHSASILNAKWVLGGKAIAVLNLDGGWGIWDISDSGLARGIAGGCPTAFTITGRIGTPLGIAAPKSSHEKFDNRSQLAPMTPGIRKIRQDGLFHGKSESTIKRGGISIKYSPSPLTTGERDESLVIWYGDSVVYLPSLRTHWQNKFKGPSSVFTTSASGHLRDMPSISLEAEARISVSAFPLDESPVLSSSGQIDLLIAGERSLLFSSGQSTGRMTPTNPTTANQSRVSDQSLLSKGLLDVDGLDRMLDGIPSGRSGAESRSSGVAQKRLLFK